MHSSRWTLFWPFLSPMSIRILTFLWTITRALLGNMWRHGSLSMWYRQSLPSSLARSPLLLSGHMDYSTCFDFGDSEEWAPYFRGTHERDYVTQSTIRIALFYTGGISHLFELMLTVNRLEKDRKFNYFWIRCAKLICVSTELTFRPFWSWLLSKSI